MNRKDEHIKLAKLQETSTNGFDKIYFEHDDLPNLSIDDVDLSTTFLGFKVDLPFYINAMTGGSKQAESINAFLSKLAAHFNIPMISGSLSVALKDPNQESSYKVIRENHPKGIIVSNVNPNVDVKSAKKAIDILSADALSIHLNVIQELIMPEGDRDFRLWQSNIKSIHDSLTLPILVKEVGFGMSLKTIDKLMSIGIKHIDISGSGGTSFLDIESKRGNNNYDYLKDLSIDSAEILLKLRNRSDLNIYASGGIRNAYDVIKSLNLGARACGMSRYFLNLTLLTFDEAIKAVDKLILDLKKIMVMLGVENINKLRTIEPNIKS